MRRDAGIALCLAALATSCSAYLSGFVGSQLEKGDPVPVFVNSLTSIDGVVPYSHYELDFCRPGGPKGKPELIDSLTNLGTTLRGVQIYTSPYNFRALEDVECAEVCVQTLGKAAMAKFEKFTKRRYRANFIVQNLPAVMLGADKTEPERERQQSVCLESRGNVMVDIRGAPVGGCSLPDEASKVQYFIYNHIDFTVHYNWVDESQQKLFIVGFFVKPESRQEKCVPSARLSTTMTGDKVQVPFTYGVRWELKKDATWATRWDYYLNSSYLLDNKIADHWERITRALLVILFLTGLVALILMRTLHLDFNRYNDTENPDEAQEEVGWKLIHTEVFRPPPYPNLFASFVGTGTQIIGMAVFSVCLALMQVLTPAKRGLMLTTMIFLFVLMAFANGYVTGMLQMMFGTRQWKTIFFSGTAYPAFVFIMWAITEYFLAQQHASNSVNFKTIMSIILLWFGVCVPQAVLGATFSYRQAPVENPLRYNKQERKIPPQQWYFSPIALVLLPGLVPYAAAYYELELIMRSVWQGQVLHLFAFVALVFFAVSIAVCEVVLYMIYYQLVYEDYRWWWSSLLIPSGLGFYYMVYCVFYFQSEIHVRTPLGTWMYFSFCLAVGLAIILAAGTMGFFSSWLFIRKIYTSIKIE